MVHRGPVIKIAYSSDLLGTAIPHIIKIRRSGRANQAIRWIISVAAENDHRVIRETRVFGDHVRAGISVCVEI